MISGCGKSDKTAPQNGAVLQQERVIPVEVVAVDRQDLSITKSFTGALKGSEQADVTSRIPERIVAIKTAVGQSVSKDQTVIVLDKSGPSSQYLQAEAGFLNAERSLSRMKALYAEGAISLQSLEGTQTAFDVAKANFEATRKTVELTAPISGSVVAVSVQVGDMANPGQVLMTIAQIEKMKVIFNMNESDVFDLEIGQIVTIESENRPGVTFEGKITEVLKSADTQSRTFEVRGVIINTPDRWLKPGMFVKVKYQSKPSANALVVPNQAILSDGITSRVFVVENGKAVQRIIVTGISDGLNTVAVSGLNENENVVTVGWNSLRDGSSVKIISTSK